MKRLAVVAFLLGFVGVMGFAQAADKDDPTGTWAWETKRKGKDGNETTTKSSMKLELKDGKLTGSVASGGGGGGKGGKGGKGGAKDTMIEDGKFSKGEFSFNVTRTFGENKFVTKYSGKVADDTIKMTITTNFGDKENKTEVEAKRVKEEARKDK